MHPVALRPLDFLLATRMSKNEDEKNFPVKRKVEDESNESGAPKKKAKEQSLFTGEMSELDMAYDGWLMKAPANADKLKPKSKRRGSAQKRAQARKSGEPRKALNSYSIFFREQREVIVAEREAKKQPKIDFEELGREVGRRWKKLSEPELQRFKRLADADSARYKAEMEAYEESQQKPKKASSLPELPTADYQQVYFPPDPIKNSSSYPFLAQSKLDHRDYRDYPRAPQENEVPAVYDRAPQEWNPQGVAANPGQDASFMDSKMPAADVRSTAIYHQVDPHAAQRRLSGQEEAMSRRSSESSRLAPPNPEGMPFAESSFQPQAQGLSMNEHEFGQRDRGYSSDAITPSIFDQNGADFFHDQQSSQERDAFQTSSQPLPRTEEGEFSPPSINDAAAQDLFWEPRPIAPGYEAAVAQDTKNDDDDENEASKDKSVQNPW